MLNFDSIISAGCELLSAKDYLFTKYHAPIYVGHNAPRDLIDRLNAVHTADRIIWTIAEVTGIEADTIIKAARAYNAYYERGGEKVLDAAELIRKIGR